MPGVPPDAANIVKRVFKGIFKRGKKNRQDGADGTTSTPPSQQQQDQSSSAPSAQSPAPQIDTKPPQLPPIGNASPLQGATESSKPVPPTHPLSTGAHTTPQEAVPLKKDAHPAPGPPLGESAATPPAGTAPVTSGLKEPEKLGASNADVSPPVSTMDTGDAPKSSAVSAISNEQPKTDGAVDGVAAEPEQPTKVDETKAVEPSTKPLTATNNTTTTTTTATETTEPSVPALEENIPPQTNGTSPTVPTSSPPTDTTTAATTDSTAAATTDSKPDASDEKMPAIEEPPPIKAVRAAPGMSATSGPLEDFPEGGDMKDH